MNKKITKLQVPEIDRAGGAVIPGAAWKIMPADWIKEMEPNEFLAELPWKSPHAGWSHWGHKDNPQTIFFVVAKSEGEKSE